METSSPLNKPLPAMIGRLPSIIVPITSKPDTLRPLPDKSHNNDSLVIKFASPPTKQDTTIKHNMPLLQETVSVSIPIGIKKTQPDQSTKSGHSVTINREQKTQANEGKRIPDGYETIKGNLPKGLSEVATTILKKGNPIGTYTPFVLDGKEYMALNEYHTHYANRPNDPPGKIYAITVFRKI